MRKNREGLYMCKGCYIDRTGVVPLLKYSHFIDAGLMRHGITTRIGGVSQGFLSSLNMGRRGLESPEVLSENFRRVSATLGVSEDSFVRSDQVHGTAIAKITRENSGSPITETDGLITDETGVTLTTYYADCMAIMLYDPRRKAIGMAHGGWRGTAKAIGPMLASQMAEHYNSAPKDMLAALGPAIGPCCFQVGSEVVDIFESMPVLQSRADWHTVAGGKPHLDLAKINRRLLIEAGIPDESIISADMCTACNVELFYSHRREQGNTGRLSAVMAL